MTEQEIELIPHYAATLKLIDEVHRWALDGRERPSIASVSRRWPRFVWAEIQTVNDAKTLSEIETGFSREREKQP
jgi:hypothetical protein